MIGAGTLLALFTLMSRLARIRNRLEYLAIDLDTVEVIEPGSTPMADARARAAALELLHAGDAQRSDLVPALDPAIDVHARTDERRRQDARTN